VASQLVSATYAAFFVQAALGVSRQLAQAGSALQKAASPQQLLTMQDAQSGRESVTPPHTGPFGFGLGIVTGIVGGGGMTGIVGSVVPPPAAMQVAFVAQTVAHALPHWHLIMSV
jgi:hypothetical protein